MAGKLGFAVSAVPRKQQYQRLVVTLRALGYMADELVDGSVAGNGLAHYEVRDAQEFLHVHHPCNLQEPLRSLVGDSKPLEEIAVSQIDVPDELPLCVSRTPPTLRRQVFGSDGRQGTFVRDILAVKQIIFWRD